MIRPGLLSAVLALAPAFAWAPPAETGHLKVELVGDTDALRPGSPLQVGLRFEMEPQWHIYWRNPGDSGEPPRVRWKLPPGFQAGEVQWPAPERLGSGSVIDYGYRESVLLPVAIRTPDDLAPGGSVTLSAEVSWLVCKDICMPGQAVVTLTVPVRMAPGPASPSHALFQEAGARLPQPLPPSWTVEATAGKAFFVLTIHGAGGTKASFLPLESGQIDNAAPQTLAAVPGGLRLTLQRSDQLSQAPARLDGVLELGPGRAYAVSAPVRPSPD